MGVILKAQEAVWSVARPDASLMVRAVADHGRARCWVEIASSDVRERWRPSPVGPHGMPNC